MSIMQPEQYQHTIRNYSDDQLLEMLTSPALYHDDAMLAAVWEAEKRRFSFSGLKELKLKYEAIYSMVLKAAHEESKEKADSEVRTVPELFSPIAVFWFTLLFNTLFGGFMLAYNLNKVNKKAQMQVYVFTVLYTVGGMLAVSLIQLGALFPFVYNLAGAFILRDYFWKRLIPMSQKFRVKPAQVPFLIGIGYSVLLLVVLYFFGDAIFPAAS
ncbi:MAG: hypothetical protein C0593_11315 [Marinilabiliales bacterium]|nr:MAG: hypothetical protein C0593_11315 [Marinilabiliales bacterium]